MKSVTGGVNLTGREFYELVGEQLDQLSMYSDEIDVGIEAEKAGFKMVMIHNARYGTSMRIPLVRKEDLL